MISNSLNRQIGSIFMIVGTEVGAGVLALPIIISHAGIFFGSAVLIFAWALMLYTALLVCEVNSTLNEGISFASMAEKFLGKYGKFFISIIFFCTLSAIAMAYISAAGSTFHNMLKMSSDVTSTIFVIVFGSCVIIGIKVVDYVNRLLLSIKLGGFLVAIFLLLAALKLNNLQISGEFKNIIVSLPAIMTAFILHNIIPSIRVYLHNDQKALRRVVIIASLIPLVLYITWVIAIIGNIPHHGPNSFDLLYAKGTNANVGDLLAILSNNTADSLIIVAINFVATISLTTSFLGTSISLYHFTQDLLGHKTSSMLRITGIPIFITFIIPLLTVILYPDIFIMALSYAGVGATILFVLVPIIIIKKMGRDGHRFSLPILHNNTLLNLSFVIGLGIVLIQFSF